MFEEWDLGTACEDIAAAWDNHGDIVVGNDVWIGLPAKPIRRRYDEETAARLEKLRWWDWPEAQVRRAIPLLQAGDLDALEKLV